ncbi:luciferin 4-monooxygenase-like, partial [Oppia nitens]|uniref:luciferin 4-monooxygenase-like n=1 Tax=Oppia nitens TaxID=1686743 RepID=UPI0023DAF213
MALNFGQYLRRECGLETGDIVCLITYNNDIHSMALLGVLAAGGVYTSLQMSSTENEIQTTVSTIKPNILIGFEGNVAYLKQMKQNFDCIKTILILREITKTDYTDDNNTNELLITNFITNTLTTNKLYTDSDDNNCFLPISRSTDDWATLIMSSGTTGAQKSIIWTNGEWLANMSIVGHRDQNPITGDDILLAQLYCHGAGVTNLFKSIAYGSQLVVNSSGSSSSSSSSSSLATNTTINLLHKYRITSCLVLPNDLLYLLNNSQKYDKQYLQSVSDIRVMGSALSGQLYDQIKQLYGFEKFNSIYALSECGIVMTKPLNSEQHVSIPTDSIGCVVPGMEVKVIDESGNSLPANQTGQLCIRGPTIKAGYYGNKDVFTNLFTIDGFLMTGDIGYYDENEFFYFVDRIKDIIKFNGKIVSTIELENQLLTHPSVERAAVIGIDSQLYGQIPMAFVTLNTGAIDKAGDIKEFVNKRVDVNKQLRGGLKILDKMPLTSLGKINKSKLKTDSESGRKWTRGQVLKMALNFGRYLRRECGLETGDIVCLITYNNDYHGIGVLGVLAAGGVYTSLDMTSTENTDSDDNNSFVPISRSPDDLATLIMTSGSTGAQKAVIWTNRQWLANVSIRRHPEVMSPTDSYADKIILSRLYCHGAVTTKPLSRQHVLTSANNIGCVVPGMEVKIIDESGNSLPANQTGQLCIRGPTVRISVSPIELENQLLTHPSVEMAAVIGIDSELYGQIPMAFVTLNTGAIDKAGDIKEFVNKRVDVNKQLRGGLKILDKMPLTSLGKINKSK